ncbi:8359_t:CDS:2 [Entrophospora sp. SA101]|nr:8359_t:CDS:2 [Entrophospora sp. SA101]
MYTYTQKCEDNFEQLSSRSFSSLESSSSSSSLPLFLIPSLSHELSPPRIIIRDDKVSFLINNNLVPFDRRKMLEIRKLSNPQCSNWIFTSLMAPSLSSIFIRNKVIDEHTKMAVEKLLNISWEIADDHFKNFFKNYIVKQKPCLIAFDNDNNGSIVTGGVNFAAVLIAYVPILEIFFTIPTVEEYVSNLPPIKLKSGNNFIIFRGLAHKSLLKYEKHDSEMERSLKTISGMFKDIWRHSDHVFQEYFMNFFISVKKIRPRNHVWVECNDNETQCAYHPGVPKNYDDYNDTLIIYNYYYHRCGCRRDQ